MWAIWSLVPLPFLNTAWTLGSSQFTYCWSLSCKILSITLLIWKDNCLTVWKFFGTALLGNWKLGYDSFSPFLHFLNFSSLSFLPLFASVSSVQFRHSVMSNCLWSHGLQHARPPCPSPTLGVNSNSCPMSWWCHSTISSSLVPFCSPLYISQH